MKQRITVIILGVENLNRSLRFYRDGLGLKTEGIIGAEFEHGAVVFSTCRLGRSWRLGRAAASRTTQVYRSQRRLRPSSLSATMCSPKRRWIK